MELNVFKVDVILEESEPIPKKETESRVLVIGDLHAPFIKKGYLEFCKEMQVKYKANIIVFIGDVLDNHYLSYHEKDPDGLGANAEAELAKLRIAEFHEAFPNAFVTIGNHDSLANRKAFSSGVSRKWVKSLKEVLDTPNWTFCESKVIDDVMYLHGVGRIARSRAKDDMISVVQGHYHSKSYIEHFVGKKGDRIFAMQIGTGVDQEAYAFAYGKWGAACHVNVGIVIDGNLPIIEYMD